MTAYRHRSHHRTKPPVHINGFKNSITGMTIKNNTNNKTKKTTINLKGKEKQQPRGK